jgi:prevent-host-death family protein
MVINTHEAKTHLSRLIERAAAGEEIILGKAGRPMAKLVPYDGAGEPRRPGLWRGRVRLAPDFDDTPSELVDDFEGR